MCVCGRNPDAYWHRNSLWSPFSSSLKGGFGLQAAVCSLVIVPPEPWAGFLANKQGSKDGELQRLELEHLHTQKFCVALGAHQNHPGLTLAAPYNGTVLLAVVHCCSSGRGGWKIMPFTWQKRQNGNGKSGVKNPGVSNQYRHRYTHGNSNFWNQTHFTYCFSVQPSISVATFEN